MPKEKKDNVFLQFKKMPIDSIPKTIFVAVILCLFLLNDCRVRRGKT